MGNEEKYITLSPGCKLHYYKWGQGKRLLVAFHGYGNDAYMFQPFSNYLQDHYTIISIDLPYQGKSIWQQPALFEKDQLIAIIHELLAEYGLQKLSLCGYSLGGRLCLTIMQMIPGHIDKAVLIAPTGLTKEPLYYFATKTLIGRKWFDGMLKNPRWYFKLLKWLSHKGIIDSSLFKFVMQHLESKDSRSLLQQIWTTMKNISPDRRKLKLAIKQYKIPVYIFTGMYDKIIPPATAEKFKKGLESVQVYILPKGHMVLDNNNAQQIVEHLL